MSLTITKNSEGLNEVNLTEPKEFIPTLNTIFAVNLGGRPCFIAPSEFTNNPHGDTKHTWHVRSVEGMGVANELPAYTASSLRDCIKKLLNAGNPVYAFSHVTEFLVWALDVVEG